MATRNRNIYIGGNNFAEAKRPDNWGKGGSSLNLIPDVFRVANRENASQHTLSRMLPPDISCEMDHIFHFVDNEALAVSNVRDLDLLAMRA